MVLLLGFSLVVYLYTRMYACMYVCMYKFVKLVHLIRFIIRIYHDARYIVCQIVENIRELYNRFAFRISQKVCTIKILSIRT